MKRSRIRRKPLKDSAKGVIDRAAREAWAKGARSKPCANCGIKRGLIRGHHVIYVQELKRLVRDPEALERALWDNRNRLPLCDLCHEAHHNASRRISIAVIRAFAPKVWQFAHEIDRDWSANGASPATRFLETAYVS